MKYYVYVYLDPLKPGQYHFGKFHFNHEPFYIGFGKNNRIDVHVYESKITKHKSFKHNKILKILKNGEDPIRYKLYENITEYSAKRLERYLIKLIGRRDLNEGTLVNLTDGGDGSVNYIPSEESINKIIETIGESRRGELNANYGKKWSDEQKKLSSIRQKENHKHLQGNMNPSKREDVRKILSETKMGISNPNSKKWLLISPSKDEYIIEGGIKRNLKLFGVDYQSFKIKEKIRINKKGWILKEI